MSSKFWMATCCAAALLGVGAVGGSAPAVAQGNIIGGIVGGMIGGPMIGPGRVYRDRSYRDRSSRRGRGTREQREEASDDNRRPTKADKVLASLGAPPSKDQTRVLKAVAASGTLGAVGSFKDLAQVGLTSSSEGDRDYTDKIKKLIERFQEEQRSNKTTTPGDVTGLAVEQSLQKAFKNAKLDTFEGFVGENWTAERLRVMVLNRVYADVGRLFDGNNRGMAPMLELDELIQRSAQSVYRRIFELSELLAANKGSALFVQRLYQTHGGLLDDEMREVADGMLTRAAATAVTKYEGPMRRDENGFALRYRAQRIVLDCLSENVERISSSETGMATVGEIEQKIAETTKSECARWLDVQFGAEKDKLTAQKPMPLRVIGSSLGPKDDPTMYAGARGER